MQIFSDYEIGAKLNYHYLNSRPFPHIVLDNFINSNIATQCFNELKTTDHWATESSNNEYMRDHQVNKFYTPWSHESSIQLQYKAPTVYHTIQYFNSNIFLSYLEDLTGIKGLKGDPNFAGGGAHRISAGGKLSLHVDFNIHPQTNHFRVLNLLLYLNPNWIREWEGCLELWDMGSKKCAKKVEPIFNRAVIFTLSDKSVHGHPIPLKTPPNIERYSLALYYYIEQPNQEYYERRAVVWHDF